MANFTLSVGETVAVRPRWWGRSWSVTYAGTLRDGTYSVAVTWTMGHSSAAYNLFLGPEQRQFRLAIGVVDVLEVTPTRLRLSFEKGGGS